MWAEQAKRLGYRLLTMQGCSFQVCMHEEQHCMVHIHVYIYIYIHTWTIYENIYIYIYMYIYIL